MISRRSVRYVILKNKKMSRVIVPFMAFCFGHSFYVRNKDEYYDIIRKTDEFKSLCERKIRALQSENEKLYEDVKSLYEDMTKGKE